MKLLAYNINGTPVNELMSYTGEQLNGNLPYIIDDNIISGYTDISSIENWHNIGQILIGQFDYFKDWKCLRSKIKEKVEEKAGFNYSNFNNLSTEEKKIACVYIPNLINPIDFVTTITSQEERIQISTEFDIKSSKSREQRFKAARIFTFSNLNVNDCMNLINDISDKLTLSYFMGIESKELDGHDGLFDYIESKTGTIYENNGLLQKNITPISGLSLLQFSQGLMSILREGRY